MAFLLVVVVAAAALAALGLLAFNAARGLVRSRMATLRTPAAPAIENGATPERYLAAVDEFSRLAELALTQPVDAPPRGNRIRQATRDARSLHATARALTRSWSGGEPLAACLFELQDASEALLRYLTDLQQPDDERAVPAALRWRREELARRRDLLIQHLRAADFRTAAGRTQTVRAW